MRNIIGGTIKKKNGAFKVDPDPKLSNLVGLISKQFSGIKLNIKPKESGGGVVQIQYDSEKDIEALLQKVQSSD